jgi:hypothetical protein
LHITVLFQESSPVLTAEPTDGCIRTLTQKAIIDFTEASPQKLYSGN